MYDKEFASLYDKYGWNDFSIHMGDAILEFLENENIKIKNHLDLACGIGALCYLFYKHNIPTKGVDISKSMLSLARKKYPEITFEEHDITKYQTTESYTLVTCTCDAVNHILKEEDLEKLFQNAYSFIEENGYFIFDIINEKEVLLNKSFRSKRSEEIYVEYYLTTKEKNKINNNIKIFQNGKQISEENLIEVLYSQEQITKIAEKIGFRVIKISNHIMAEQYRTNNKIFFILKK